MSAKMRMVMLEFNELCSDLIHEFMADGRLPNFRRLYDRSTVYSTQAGETAPRLEPWILWPTVHSGMTYAEHGIFELGDGDRLKEKCVAELLSDAGIPVGVFGSMNTNYRRLHGYLIPDPWRKDGATVPKSFQPFYDIVAAQVQESSRPSALTRSSMARLGMFLLGNGLSLETMRTAVGQLLDEKRDRGFAWRRASILDHLQYDVFRKGNQRHGVQFATFFCNSTAHYQHYFWRNMRPETFAAPPGDDAHASLRDAIAYGYRSMDQLIGRTLTDYPDATVVLCTALSQRPWMESTKCTFRPTSFARLLEFAGIDARSVVVSPVMAEQFHLDFTSSEALERASIALHDLQLADRQVMVTRRESDLRLFCGCNIFEAQSGDALVVRRSDRTSKPSKRFLELFYMIHSVRSGYHDPSGSFWVGNGRHQLVSEAIPIIDIAPTILRHFDIEKPPYMRGSAAPVHARATH